MDLPSNELKDGKKQLFKSKFFKFFLTHSYEMAAKKYRNIDIFESLEIHDF
jgi:hypothetical protein